MNLGVKNAALQTLRFSLPSLQQQAADNPELRRREVVMYEEFRFGTLITP